MIRNSNNLFSNNLFSISLLGALLSLALGCSSDGTMDGGPMAPASGEEADADSTVIPPEGAGSSQPSQSDEPLSDGTTIPPAPGSSGSSGGEPSDDSASPDDGTPSDGSDSPTEPGAADPGAAGSGAEPTEPMDPQDEPGSPASPPPAGGCLQGSGDFSGDGPYQSQQMDISIGSEMYTIFYPDPLESDCAHPIVAWGNGTGVTGSGTYAFYHEHAASWGIITIASHNSNTGSGMFHMDGLNYLLDANEDSSSMFFGKIGSRAGTSGHSQGGIGANAGARHENVVAEVNVQGAFGGAPPNVAFLCLTGTEDIATEGCRSAVDSTSEPALYANWEGGTHTGTATLGGFIGGDPGTRQYMRLYTAWFRCFLAEDEAACMQFQGDCSICSDPGWAQIQVHNF